MAIAPVQSNQGAQNTGLATVTASFSSATTSGNLLLLIVGSDDYAATPPTGWTQSTGCGQQTFLGHYVWWRVSNGLTTVQYTIGSAATSCWIAAEYSGADPSPFDVSNGQLNQSAGSTYTTPTITPTTGNRLLVASIGAATSLGQWTAGASLGTWLNSFTEVTEINTTLGSGTRDIIGLATRTVTGNSSTTYSSGATYASPNTEARTGIILSFKEATASPSTPATRRGQLPALLDM